MRPTVPARLTVWLVAVFVGALGWWMALGVLASVYELPRASYGHALGIQLAIQIIFQCVIVSLGAVVADGE